MSSKLILSNFLRQKALLRVFKNQNKAPIFADLQFRSAVAIEAMADDKKFEDTDAVITAMTGLISRVNNGLSMSGTPGWKKLLKMFPFIPHEATIFGGPFVHVPEDIGGGLDDSLSELGRLPPGIDYREMYAAVRASFDTVNKQLLLEVGANSMSSAIGFNKAIIAKLGIDPVQALRDRQYTKRKGILAPGLPSEENIDYCTSSILKDFDSNQRIIV